MIKACIYHKQTGEIKLRINAPVDFVLDQESATLEYAVGISNGATHIDVYGDYSAYTIPPKLVVATRESLLTEIRFRRDKLLKEYDWTQMPDSPLLPDQKQAWALYRQALRDFPDTCPDLSNPVWPTPPDKI